MVRSIWRLIVPIAPIAPSVLCPLKDRATAKARPIEHNDTIGCSTEAIRLYRRPLRIDLAGPRVDHRIVIGALELAPGDPVREQPTIVQPVASTPLSATARRRAGRLTTALVRRHPIAAYAVVAYGLSWAWWLPIAFRHQIVAKGIGWPTHFPGLLGPMVAALASTALISGREGDRDLGARMFRWRIGVRGWALALGTPLLLVAVGLAVDSQRSWTGLEIFNGLPRIGPLPVWAALVFITGIGEETGWRGFVLPRLRERHGLVGSSLLLALIWGAWHIPLFAILETFRGFNAGTLVGFLIGLACGSLVLAWLYEYTGASILAAAVWHGTYNVAAATGDSAIRSAIVTTVVILWAVLIVVRNRHRTPLLDVR